MLPKTDEPIETKTTAQKINELSEQGSMNHRTMIAEAKHTDFMNPYSMSCGNETSVKTTLVITTGAARYAEKKSRALPTSAAW